MGLVGLGKKKEEAGKQGCCCSCNTDNETIEKAEKIKKAGGIKILGGGCAKCHELEDNTIKALSSLGIDETVELITDFSIIAMYGVMSTPALVVDNKVVSYRKVLNVEEIATTIREVRNI